jgi:short-subunit dehydrogenase involved in D-alanine esterification of teichoic acids
MKVVENKILITGGSKGIGFALAKKFLALGNTVIITGRNHGDLLKAKAVFSQLIIIQCDLTQPDDFDLLVTTVKREHRDLNILINNAGVQFNYSFLHEHEATCKMDQEVNTNFVAPIKLTWQLLPILSCNKNAAVVNISSALGVVPKKTAAVYSATKAALHVFTMALRLQLEDVKIFEVIPPLVDTQMTMERATGKISAEQLAEKFIRLFERDVFEMKIGKTKLLLLLNRLNPALPSGIINNA